MFILLVDLMFLLTHISSKVDKTKQNKNLKPVTETWMSLIFKRAHVFCLLSCLENKELILPIHYYYFKGFC